MRFPAYFVHLYIKLIRETQVRIPAAPEESEEDAERTGLVQDLVTGQ